MATLALAAVAAGALTLVAPKPAHTTSRPDVLVTGGYTRVTATPGPHYSTHEPGLVNPMRDYADNEYSSPEFFYAKESHKHHGNMSEMKKKKKGEKNGKNDGKKGGTVTTKTETGTTTTTTNHNNTLSPRDPTKANARPSQTGRRYVKPPPALKLDSSTPANRNKMNQRSQQIKRDVCNNVVVQIALQYDASMKAIKKGKAKAPADRVKKARAKLAAMLNLVKDAEKQANNAMSSDFPIKNLEVLRGYATTAGALATGIVNDLYNPNNPVTNAPIGRDKKVAGDLLPLDYIGTMVNILSWSNTKSANGPPALTVSSTTDSSVSLGDKSSLNTQQFRIAPVAKLPGAYTITDAVTGRFLGANDSCSRPQLVTQSSAKTLWAFRLVGSGMNSTLPVYLMKVWSPPKCMGYLSLNGAAANDVILNAKVDNTSEAQSWVIVVSANQPYEEDRTQSVVPPPQYDPQPSNKDLASLGNQQNAALNNSGTMTDSGNQSQATQNSVGDVTYSVNYGGNSNQQDGNMYGSGGYGGGYLWGGGGYSTGGYGASAGGPSLTLSGGSNMSDSANTTLSSRSQGLVDNSIKVGEGSARSLFDTESADDAVRSFGLEAGWTAEEGTSAPVGSGPPPPPPAPPAPSAPSSPIPPTPTIVQTPPKKKKMPAGAIVALVLLVLIMAVGSWFGYRWWKNRKAGGGGSSGGNGGGGSSNNANSPPSNNNRANSSPARSYNNMYRAAAAQPQAARVNNAYS